MISACAGRTSSERKDEKSTREFRMPVPPAMMQDRNEISEYMASHFWDSFMEPAQGYRCDSIYVSGVKNEDLEQYFANYIYFLNHVPFNSAVKALGHLADRLEQCEAADTSSNVFEAFKDLGEKYLFDPNSPLRNEDYFNPLAARLAESSHLTDVEKGRFARLAELTSLNRTGTVAADFRFSDAAGRIRTLHGIEAGHTLLFFSNPGCTSCMEIIESLKSLPEVSRKIDEGSLAVVNIYIDEDIEAWRNYMPIYPEEWYNGFDPDLIIRTDCLYSVRAIPSLYLLDKDKKVIMKDAVPEKVLKFIQGL